MNLIQNNLTRGTFALICGFGVIATAFVSVSASADEANVLKKPAAELSTANPLTVIYEIECFANQRYSDAEGKAGLCDVYAPRQAPPAGGWPAIVVVHGGGWITGDKWTLEGYSRLLAKHGFVVVTMNYRLAPTFKFPAQVDDVRKALIWTAENADRFSIDLNRLGMFGYSAGGHLSSLVCVLADEPMAVQITASEWADDDPRWQKMPKVHAVCAGAPPCDFRQLPIDNTALAYFLGGSRRELPGTYQAASPTAHASTNDPPLQIIHGDADLMVPLRSSKSLYNALRSSCVDVRLQTVPSQGHMATFLNMNTRQSVLEFFQGQFIKPRLSNWDMRTLATAPPMNWIDDTSPIRSLTYTGQPFGGKPTEVFAFYATPGTISGDPSQDKDLPAVVLIHGGGGTAFADWVWLWAQRGYAAIAMDLSGRRPQAPTFKNGKLVSNMRVTRTRLPAGGPDQGSAEKFASVGGTIEDDWPYHAVGNVIRAHSLIRSFPEIDSERTAVTGISWGGYTTCIVASVDDRFKAAVPVYGCGFLHDGESVQREQIDALATEQRKEWIRQYDPSSHLANCRVPIFFVNGTNDKHYPLKSYSRSFDLVPGDKQLRIEPRMSHSHQAGWQPEEIGLFVDHHLRGETALPKLGPIKSLSSEIELSYQSDLPLKSAALHYTTDDGPLLKRSWQSIAAEIGEQSIRVAQGLPTGASIFFINVTDQRGATVSSSIEFAQ